MALPLAGPAQADTVVVVGADGAPGQPGGNAPAQARFVGESIARARAGQGGEGVDGAPGGVGVATAVTQGDADQATAVSSASGGTGGSADGGVGGEGGRARARASVTAPEAFLGVVKADADAFGGRGGTLRSADTASVSGRGGDADASADATAEGNADVMVTSSAQAGRAGEVLPAAEAAGSVSGQSGSATASGTGLARGDGDVVVFVSAGTTFSRELTEVGDSRFVATAEGHGEGSGNVTVRASARVDARAPQVAPPAGGPQNVQATATGSSAGGGNVEARTNHEGQAGGLLEVRDTVSGSTAGHLLLIQSVIAGDEGSAVTSLEGENPGGGSLEVRVEVRAAPTQLDPSTAVIERAFGRSSTGGDVLVTGRAFGARPPDTQNEPAGDGGDARIVNAVDGETSGTLRLRQEAFGGDGGTAVDGDIGDSGSGGSAWSELERDADVGHLQLEVTAEGGDGGGTSRFDFTPDPVGDGGDAHVRARGSNAQGSTTVLGLARGGEAQLFFLLQPFDEPFANGGSASVVAEASGAPGAGDVTIGSFDDDLSGAFGGDSQSGDGGDATSRSVGSVSGDSALTVIDRAIGGSVDALVLPGPNCPPVPFPIPCDTITVSGVWDGGDAVSSAIGESEGSGTVIVSAEAVAGDGAGGGDAGVATLGEVYGSSANGGRVEVSGHLEQGIGRNAEDAVLENAVGGDTSGELRLEQTAISRSGDLARSVLTADRSVEGLELLAAATGRTVESVAKAVNRAGSASATASADGASATSRSTAISFGDGHAVRAGTEGFRNALGSTRSDSRSVGIAFGDSTVEVLSMAQTRFTTPRGRNGADAIAKAFGANHGRSLVQVEALATGSAGGSVSEGTGVTRGGDASAHAKGIGWGIVEVRARGRAGRGGAGSNSRQTLGRGGTGEAEAIAIGASGFARAEASTGGGRVTLLAPSVEVPVSGVARSVARAGFREAFERTPLRSGGLLPGRVDAAVRTVAQPRLASVEALLDGQDALPAIAGTQTLVLGEVGATRVSGGHDPSSDTVSGTIDITLNQRSTSFGEGNIFGLLRVGFLDAEIKGAGFEEFRLQVSVEDELLVDEQFDSAVDALAFFDAGWLELGTFAESSLDLAIDYAIVLGDEGWRGHPFKRAKQGFGFAFAVTAVPEPATLWLVAALLGALVVTRRGARPC